VIKDVLNLAYQPEQVTIWWVAIGIGVVVDLVVIALLNLLTRFVQDIDEGVEGVVSVIRRAADNTSQTRLIAVTADAVDTVLAEGLQHHLFLTRVLTKVGPRMSGQMVGRRR
jgi:hypothetical protein